MSTNNFLKNVPTSILSNSGVWGGVINQSPRLPKAMFLAITMGWAQHRMLMAGDTPLRLGGKAWEATEVEEGG